MVGEQSQRWNTRRWAPRRSSAAADVPSSIRIGGHAEQRTGSTASLRRYVIRYWAGARAAAGVDDERLPAVATVRRAPPRSWSPPTRPLEAVLPVCSVLVEGRASSW